MDTRRGHPANAVLRRAGRVLIADQREIEIRDDRLARGIPLHPSIVTLLNRLAEEVGVPLPEPL